MGPPLLYAVVVGVISALLSYLIDLLGIPSIEQLLSGPSTPAQPVPFPAWAMLIVQLVAIVPGLFIGAAVLHLGMMMFSEDRHWSYSATFRVACYASCVDLFSWIPYIGFLAALYSIYITVVGLRTVHGMSTGRAVAAVLVPGLVILLVCCVLGAIGVLLFAQSGSFGP